MRTPVPSNNLAPCPQRMVIDRKETQAVSEEPCVFDQQGYCETHGSPRLLPDGELCVNAKHRFEQTRRKGGDYIIDPKLQGKVDDLWEM